MDDKNLSDTMQWLQQNTNRNATLFVERHSADIKSNPHSFYKGNYISFPTIIRIEARRTVYWSETDNNPHSGQEFFQEWSRRQSLIINGTLPTFHEAYFVATISAVNDSTVYNNSEYGVWNLSDSNA